LLWCVAAGAGVVAVADADAPLRAALSAALEANERLREELARRDAEIERLSAELAVLQRMVFRRSSERAWPQDLAPDGDGGGDPGRDREGTRHPGPGMGQPHRAPDYPMVSLHINATERAPRRPVVTRKNAYGSRNEARRRLAAAIWTVTATATEADLNVPGSAYRIPRRMGHSRSKPLTSPDLEQSLPWNAAPEDLRAWAKPPAPG
jgi:hypothetical protein